VSQWVREREKEALGVRFSSGGRIALCGASHAGWWVRERSEGIGTSSKWSEQEVESE
jgi:hypothetical protein